MQIISSFFKKTTSRVQLMKMNKKIIIVLFIYFERFQHFKLEF
jgi:hypothetical protein